MYLGSVRCTMLRGLIWRLSCSHNRENESDYPERAQTCDGGHQKAKQWVW